MSTCDPADGEVDFAPPLGYLEQVDRWIPVDGFGSDVDVDTLAAREDTVDATVESGSDGDVELRLHSSYLAPLSSALAADAAGRRVFAAVDDDFDPSQTAPSVLFVLVDDGDQYAFLGGCGTESLSRPIDELVANGVLPPPGELVGLTGSQIAALVDQARSSSTTVASADQLVPGLAEDPQRTAGTRVAQVRLTAPGIDVGQRLICIRTQIAWGGCTTASLLSETAVALDAYVGDDSTITVWMVAADGELGDSAIELGSFAWPSQDDGDSRRVEITDAAAIDAGSASAPALEFQVEQR